MEANQRVLILLVVMGLLSGTLGSNRTSNSLIVQDYSKFVEV